MFRASADIDLNGHPRILGRYSSGRPGPTLICVGGLHGNEPMGVRALEAVLASLRERALEVAGTFLALVGNRHALAANRRFITEDLNRGWTRERLQQAYRPDENRILSEARERAELLEVLQEELDRSESCYFLDLHTTSADSGPFMVFGDTLRNRGFVRRFPVTRILGLEEMIEGPLLDYMSRRGAVAAAFEAGEHTSPESLEPHQAAVWVAIEAAGLLSPDERCAPVRPSREKLARRSRGLPRVVEVRHRHPVWRRDQFRMGEGYLNFQPVRKGEVLARDRHGIIRAPESGRILMPLYQEQGEDGFFIVREVRPIWLHLSARLRRIPHGAWLDWLPGVRRDPTRKETFLVDVQVARWFRSHFFHLLGYRRRRQSDGRLAVYSRRRE